MPISGLVLRLSADARIEDLVAELSLNPRIEVGEAVENRLPLVSETAGSGEDRALWNWIQSRQGVLHVDVAFIHLDQEIERS